MAKPALSLGGPQGAKARPARPHRTYLWRLAGWLQHGGAAAAFYLAWRAGKAGAAAGAAFVSGFLLRQLLEATSAGD